MSAFTGSGLTPGEVAAFTTLGGAALAGFIKLGTWLLENVAKRTADRRTDLNTLISRQESEIERLKEELRAERKERSEENQALERRVAQAERDRAIMEGVLFRMGWEKTERGVWKRNGNPPEGGPP